MSEQDNLKTLQEKINKIKISDVVNSHYENKQVKRIVIKEDKQFKKPTVVKVTEKGNTINMEIYTYHKENGNLECLAICDKDYKQLQTIFFQKDGKTIEKIEEYDENGIITTVMDYQDVVIINMTEQEYFEKIQENFEKIPVMDSYYKDKQIERTVTKVNKLKPTIAEVTENGDFINIEIYNYYPENGNLECLAICDKDYKQLQTIFFQKDGKTIEKIQEFENGKKIKTISYKEDSIATFNNKVIQQLDKENKSRKSSRISSSIIKPIKRNAKKSENEEIIKKDEEIKTNIYSKQKLQNMFNATEDFNQQEQKNSKSKSL